MDTKNNVYEIIDEGQGFPVNSKREDGETVLQAAFDVLNTSGKYQEDGVYGGSALGLNGIGGKLVNFLSLWTEVLTSDRSGKQEYIRFKDGIFEKREISSVGKQEHGTTVRFCPDPQFFQNKQVNISELKNLFTDIAALCPSLYIKFIIDDKEETFHSENGILDLIQKKVKDKEILTNRFYSRRTEGDNLIDFCLTYTDSYAEDLTAYVNYGLTDGGTHITTLKAGITRTINKVAKDKGLLKDKDENLTGAELSEGLVIIFNLKANGVQYDAQSKTRVVDIDKTLINLAISSDFTFWLENNEKELKTIIDRALIARKAREAAKKAKDAARGLDKKEKGLKGKLQLSNKFIDCVSKNPKERNLLLVEGLSAGSSAIEARNAKTDCIYMLRGKIISPLKTTKTKILQNQEMSDIIKVIGAGFGNNEFNLSKMNFDKIVMTTDADSDGADIELLLITFFFTYMRPLVEAGKLYRAVTPLYIVRKGKEELYFYSEEEMAEFKSKNKSGYEILRAKGLGELNAEDLHKVCFENQRFKRITISDAQKTAELLEVLQGENVGLRKKFIYENAEKLGFEFD